MQNADIQKLTARVKTTNAWKDAAMRFEFLFADNSLPHLFRLGKPLTNEEFIEASKEIVADCPAFFPAYFDMGARLLSIDIEEGIKALDTAFEISMKINSWKAAEEAYDIALNNFERLYRDELILHYALKLIKKHPKQAILYDYAAMSSLVLDEYDKAIEYGKKAVELEPSSSHYLNNLGFNYINVKDFQNADKYFRQALEADPENDTPKYNLELYEIMKEKDISFDEYCLLPIDPDLMSQYLDNDDYHKYTSYVNTSNSQKLHVLRKKILKEHQFKTHNYHSLLSTLKVFFGFVASVSQDEFIWEEVSFMHLYFKPIIHKFIFKHGDVDEEIMNEVFDSLALFYGFLSEYRVTDASDTKGFLRDMDSSKDELISKMHRYNSIRHDYGVSDKEKEKVRKELFGTDHSWMFL